MSEGVLRIGELSRRSGLSADVIRAWERRYGLLAPQRTEGGFRLYGTDDLARLRLMQHYRTRGIPTAQAAALVQRAQRAAFDANPGIPPEDARAALRLMRASLEAFDDAPADRMLERLLRVFARGAVLRDVVLPYLRELGRRWECGQATIAQEHFASSFLEGWLLTMARGWSRPGRHRAVLACVPGERHTLGLLAFGLALRDLDWRITYLGADTPLEAAARTAERVEADVVVLAAALPSSFAAVAAEIEDLARTHAVAVGGAGATGSPAGQLATRTLPADPLVAAHALTAHEQAPAHAA